MRLDGTRTLLCAGAEPSAVVHVAPAPRPHKLLASLNGTEPGRQLRASVYMADHRLYVTEATSAPGDFAALQFEQSISIINELGTDLDKNGALPSRQYNCRK